MKARKWICTLLALSLFLGCAGLTPVQAADHEVADIDQVPSQTVDLETPPSVEISQEAELVQLCEDSGIFRYVDEDTFRQANHVARLTEEETLNTYVFQNRDGTKSVYYMEEDVKYLAADGSIRDKDITLVRAGAGYDVRENNVSLGIPDSAASGIRVSHAQNSVRLIPLDGSGNATLEDNSILYADFYGAGIDLKYTPTLSGIKEDIILSAYNCVSSFDFQLETGGLYLYENGGQYYLAEQDSEEIAFYLGQIIVYDAIGRPSAGSMTVETVDHGQKYRLTISANVDFLTDPTTVYPVTIDPTITISDTIDAEMIEDSPVFSYYPNSNHTYGQFLFNSIGYTNATLGTGRTVFRFNGLLEDETFAALDEEYIESVEFFVRDAGTYGYFGVNIHAILDNNTWTESTVTWNSVSNYSDTIYASQTLGYSYWSTFDITNLAKAWKSGELDGQCGLIMVAQDESQYIVTCSTDYTYSTLWPYVVVTYSLELMLPQNSGYVHEGKSKTIVAHNNLGVADDVTWQSSDPTIATVSASGVVTGIRAGKVTITATDSEGNVANTYLYVTIPDGVYRIKSQYSQLYMGIDNPSRPQSSNPVQQNIQTEGHDYLGQLWQVQYVENGNYVLSPLHRVCQYLSQHNGIVYTQNMTSLQKENPTLIEGMRIIYSGTGYVFYANETTEYSLAPENRLVGSDIIATAYNSVSAQFRWDFELVPGIFFYSSMGTGIPAGSTQPIECGTDEILANTIVSGTGNLHTPCTWYTNNDGINPVNMYTGRISAQQRAKTQVNVGVLINNTMYFSGFDVECKETIYVKNYYDSTIDSVIRNQIEEAVAFLNQVYNKEYYLYFEMDGLPVSYRDAGIEICPYGATDPCSQYGGNCGTCCDGHHKNVNRIAEELYQTQWERNHIVVMWSNVDFSGIYCYDDSQGRHQSVGFTAAACSPFAVTGEVNYLPVIQILTIDDTYALEDMAINLAHEVAHTLGLLEVRNDAYGDIDQNHGQNATVQCIMAAISGLDKRNIFHNHASILCDYCKSKLHEEIDGIDLYEERNDDE